MSENILTWSPLRKTEFGHMCHCRTFALSFHPQTLILGITT